MPDRQQPDAQYRANRPAQPAIKQAQGFELAEVRLGHVVQHIGVEADKGGGGGHGIAQQGRRGRLATHHPQTSRQHVEQHTDGVDPTARHKAGHCGHDQHRQQRQQPDQKVNLGHRDRITPGAVHHQGVDRQAGATHHRLNATNQRKRLHAAGRVAALGSTKAFRHANRACPRRATPSTILASPTVAKLRRRLALSGSWAKKGLPGTKATSRSIAFWANAAASA